MFRIPASDQPVQTKTQPGYAPEAPRKDALIPEAPLQSCSLNIPFPSCNTSSGGCDNGLAAPNCDGVNLRQGNRKRGSFLGRILRMIFFPASQQCNESEGCPKPQATDDVGARPEEANHCAFISTADHINAIEQPNGNFGINKEAIESWSLSEKKRDFYKQAFQVSEKDFKDDLINGWYQTSEGNCVLVAGAKASMDAYGSHAFKEVKASENGLSITMRDNFKVKISTSELEKARDASDFAGENERLLAYATIMYAAAAKRAEMQGHEGSRSFSQALRSLNNGEFIQDGMKFLGLSRHLVSVNPGSLNSKDAVLACSDRHAIYVDKKENGNHVADHYGEGVSYRGTDTWGNSRRRRNRIHTAYTLKPLSEANINTTHSRENAG